MKRPLHVSLLVFAILSLVTGMLAGLGRLGLAMPLPQLYAHHGAIMVGGFLGTLIALEKVIPLKRKLLFVGPLLSAVSVVAFMIGNFEVALLLLISAGAFFIIIYVIYLRRQFDFYLLIALFGAMFWLIGNVLLLWKHFYPMAFPWWMGFLLFTIVSERLELSKFLPVTQRNKNRLIGFLVLFVVGIVIPFHRLGTYVVGLALVLISLWLMRYDVVRIAIKKKGLTRFTGVALLCGYFALLLDGVFFIVLTHASLSYDITVHTFFLGFIFSMIFAHGPIILPGVLGLSVKPYSSLFYLPLSMLLLSLLMRIIADVGILPYSYRALSGWLSAGSILLYFILMLTFTVRAVRYAKTY